MDYIRLIATAFGFLVLPVWVSAAPLLRCEVTYGGESQVVAAGVVADPYVVPSHNISGRFWFKPVMVGKGHSVEYVKIYAYFETDLQPILIQSVTYLPPLPRSRQPTDLTGTQRLYAGTSERELIYRCTLQGTKK